MSNTDLSLQAINVKHGHDLINSFVKQETITSLTVIYVEYLPTKCILGSMLKVNVN